jgi:hypothetical protein
MPRGIKLYEFSIECRVSPALIVAAYREDHATSRARQWALSESLNPDTLKCIDRHKLANEEHNSAWIIYERNK